MALVAGGLIGRVAPALVAAAAGWRLGIGVLAVLPLAAAVVMRRTLVELPPTVTDGGRRLGVRRQLRNRRLLAATAAGSAFYFTFVGTFSYVVFRLERPPFSLGPAAGSAVFALWLLGCFGPAFGTLADRIGWRRLAFAAFATTAAGLALSLPARLPTLVLGLALVTIANWSGVTAAQLGVAEASTLDRGTASALYFSIYYLTGAVGGYLPGLAWERFRWPGVVATGLTAVILAAIILARAAGARSPGVARVAIQSPAHECPAQDNQL
jgi:YNFM family putative membrane transporter